MCKINCSGGCKDCAPEEHCVNYRGAGCLITEDIDFDYTKCPCSHYSEEMALGPNKCQCYGEDEKHLRQCDECPR